jgi:hypothetical protein
MMTRNTWPVAIAMLLGCGGPEPGSTENLATLTTGAELDFASTPLGPAPEDQHISALVPRSGGYAAVWQDGREHFNQTTNDYRIYFARIAADGTVLDPTGIPIGPLLPGFGSGSSLAIACNPMDMCLLVASGGTTPSILAIRVAGNQVLDVTPRVLISDGKFVQDLDLAWDGAAFRFTWRLGSPSGAWTASIAVDGTMSTPVQVASPAVSPRVACQQPGCLLTYSKGFEATAPIAGRVVDSTGALGPEQVLYGAPDLHFPSAPSWDGQQYWLGIIQKPTTDGTFGANVLVQRIAADGTVLDPAGVLVAAGAPLVKPFAPEIGHDGTQALVLWGQINTNGGRSVRMARIADTGTVIDPGGAAFPAHPMEIDNVSERPKLDVACRPGECLAAWTEVTTDQRVRGTRLSGITELSPGGIELATAPPGTAGAAATYGLDHYFAVWRDSSDSSRDPRVAALRGTVFSPSMTPIATVELGPTSPIVCASQDQPTVAASASSYMVVWHGACTFDNNLYGQVVDGNGQPTAPAFAVDISSGNETHPSIASDGSGFLAVWDNTAAPIEIQGRRFDATGAPLGAAFTITPSGHIPVVAFDGTNYLAVWRRTNAGQRDLYAAHVTPAGVVGPEVTIANTKAGEEGESVACGGGTCLIAWRGAQIRVARVAPDGTVLDPGGIVVATVTGSVFATSVAWDGQAFAVTWRTANELRAARVAPNGTLLATTHGTIAAPPTAPERPALVSNGAGHIVAFYDRFDPTPAFRVRRVRALSILDDDPPPLAPTGR